MDADPVVHGPAVEQGTDGGDARRAIDGPGGRDMVTVPGGDLQLRPDQEIVGRVEVVELRELRDGGVVAPGDAREGLAAADDVRGEMSLLLLLVSCHDRDGPRERDGVAAHECAERVRPDD